MKKILPFAILQFLVSCRSQETILNRKMPLNNVLIYKWNGLNSKNERETNLLKINKKEKTIQFADFTYRDGEQKMLDKIEIDKLFSQRDIEYFTIKQNKIKTKKYRIRHKRAWYDFATPRQKPIKGGGIKYIIKEDKLISPSGSEFVLDSKLMFLENQ